MSKALKLVLLLLTIAAGLAVGDVIVRYLESRRDEYYIVNEKPIDI